MFNLKKKMLTLQKIVKQRSGVVFIDFPKNLLKNNQNTVMSLLAIYDMVEPEDWSGS